MPAVKSKESTADRGNMIKMSKGLKAERTINGRDWSLKSSRRQSRGKPWSKIMVPFWLRIKAIDVHQIAQKYMLSQIFQDKRLGLELK